MSGPTRALRAGALSGAARPALALALMLSAGCASAGGGTKTGQAAGIIDGPGHPVVITRAGDALAITWTTRTGALYTLVYKDRPGAHQPWKPVPGYERIPGTGESQTVRLPTWPGDTRRFNVTSASAGRAMGRGPRVQPAR